MFRWDGFRPEGARDLQALRTPGSAEKEGCWRRTLVEQITPEGCAGAQLTEHEMALLPGRFATARGARPGRRWRGRARSHRPVSPPERGRPSASTTGEALYPLDAAKLPVQGRARILVTAPGGGGRGRGANTAQTWRIVVHRPRPPLRAGGPIRHEMARKGLAPGGPPEVGPAGRRRSGRSAAAKNKREDHFMTSADYDLRRSSFNGRDGRHGGYGCFPLVRRDCAKHGPLGSRALCASILAEPTSRSRPSAPRSFGGAT